MNREKAHLTNKWHLACKRLSNRINWKIVLLLSLPLLLLSLSADWIFSWPLRGHIDAWIYFGYFLDLKQHLNTFAGTYYGTRLPWILLGSLVYKLFSPLTATYVLHIGFYWLAVISLFLILRETLNRRTALLTATLLGCYHYFLEAIGNAYIDGAGLTFFLLALLMLTYAAKSERLRFFLCFSGIFFGCLIYTQLFLATYTPLIIFYYLFMNREYRKHRYLQSFVFFIIGFLSITLLLCSLNYLLNGTFLFYRPVVKWTKRFVALGPNPWWVPISSWWKTATWLFLPLLTFINSILFIVRSRSIKNQSHSKTILFFQVYFVLNVLLFIFMEFKMKQPMLYLSYYASYIMPATFLALGAQLTMGINRMRRKSFYLLLGAVIAIVMGEFIFTAIGKWFVGFTFKQFFVLVLIGVAGAAGLVFRGRRYKQSAALFVVASVLIANLHLNGSRYINFYDKTYQKNSLLAVVDGMNAAKAMDPNGNTFFWYNTSDAALGSVYRSIASTYLFGCRMINEEFPRLDAKEKIREPHLNDRIFIISNQENSFEETNKSLAALGFGGKFVDEKAIRHGDIFYKITFLEVISAYSVDD